MMTQHSLGWLGTDKIEVVVTNRTAASVAVGDCLVLDRRRLNAGDSTTNVLGTAAAGIANGFTIPAATTDMMVTETFGIVQRSAADDRRTVLRLSGYCDLVTFAAGDDVVLATSRCFVTAGGISLTAVNGAQENSGTAAAITRKVVFLPHTAVVTPGSTDGWFDGIHGFGTILFT